MSSDPRSLAHEVGIGTGLRSRATAGRVENTPFYLPIANGLHITAKLLLNCHIMWPTAATQNMCLSLMVLNNECDAFDCV